MVSLERGENLPSSQATRRLCGDVRAEHEKLLRIQEVSFQARFCGTPVGRASQILYEGESQELSHSPQIWAEFRFYDNIIMMSTIFVIGSIV